MKKIINTILLSIIFLSVFTSCKKYDDEFYGPALGYAPDDFSATALTVSNANPNFLSQQVYFESSFNATVRWKLTLTGATSGALKVLTGISAKIDSTNSLWDGSTDTLKLFRKNETVNVSLSVLGWKDTLKTSLVIGSEKYRGIVLGDFENISVNIPSQNFQDGTGYWWFFSFDAGEFDLLERIATPDVPSGNHGIRVVGHDANSSYYIGQVGLSAPSTVFNFGATNANEMYFNVYVKGAGLGDANDYKFVIQTFEDDNGGGVSYSNAEDKYTHTISLKYDGWKLHQVKYSDFVLDAGSNGNGYGSQSPNKIGNIGFFYGANTSAALSNSKLVEFSMDHFSITTNGPMIP